MLCSKLFQTMFSVSAIIINQQPNSDNSVAYLCFSLAKFWFENQEYFSSLSLKTRAYDQKIVLCYING